jgi:lipopolysaccharide export system protein LptA
MRRSSAVWAVALASALALPGAARGQGAEKRVEISSDRLVIDQNRRTARFDGKVAARYGDLALTCDEMIATYGERGAVTVLEAKGRVTVRQGDAVAEAGFARLDAKGKLLVLEGAPIVTRGPHRLKGKRIAVHLDTGEIEVLEAQGTFTLPLGEGR